MTPWVVHVGPITRKRPTMGVPTPQDNRRLVRYLPTNVILKRQILNFMIIEKSSKKLPISIFSCFYR